MPADVAATVQSWKDRGLSLRLLLVGQGGAAPGVDVCLADTQGRTRARWGVKTDGAAYLLRPDQHVCARWMALDAHRLNAALKQAITGVAA